MKFLNNFKWYRRWKGGHWYLHRTNTHLPGEHTEFWSRKRKVNRYTKIQRIEYYRS